MSNILEMDDDYDINDVHHHYHQQQEQQEQEQSYPRHGDTPREDEGRRSRAAMIDGAAATAAKRQTRNNRKKFSSADVNLLPLEVEKRRFAGATPGISPDFRTVIDVTVLLLLLVFLRKGRDVKISHLQVLLMPVVGCDAPPAVGGSSPGLVDVIGRNITTIRIYTIIELISTTMTTMKMTMPLICWEIHHHRLRLIHPLVRLCLQPASMASSFVSIRHVFLL